MKRVSFSRPSFQQSGGKFSSVREKGKSWHFSKKWIWGVILIPILLGILLIPCLLGSFRFVFWDAPQLLGFWSEKNYLLVMQNQNELRPGGGFMSSFAVVQISGIFPEITFYNSEEVAIPNPEIKAPAAIERVLSRDPKYSGWVFRDSNFALDFPTNAEMAMSFLKQDERFANTDFDGVITLDVQVLTDLLELFGPVEIEGQEISSENAFEALEFVAKNFDHHNLEEWSGRKNFLPELAHTLEKRLFWSVQKWPDFFDLLAREAQQKHIQFYFVDDDLQEKFREHGFTAELPSAPFWTVNFTNLGGRKGDRYLRKLYDSSINVASDGKIHERFTLHLAHEGTYNLQSDRYEAFVRIVRPKGVKFLESSGSFETLPEQKTEVYGEEISFFVVLLPGEEKLYTFEFEFPQESLFLPEMPLGFTLVKQTGAEEVLWAFTLRGENDLRFTAEGCAKNSSRENIFFCDVLLTTDTKLQFQRFADTHPPVLQFARFRNNSTLEVRFSEDIFPAIKPETIQLQAIPEEGATPSLVPVKSVTVVGNTVTINLGVTATGNRFVLEIQELQDIAGNQVDMNLGAGRFRVTVLRSDE
jgi:hypothetical protein